MYGIVDVIVENGLVKLVERWNFPSEEKVYFTFQVRSKDGGFSSGRTSPCMCTCNEVVVT